LQFVCRLKDTKAGKSKQNILDAIGHIERYATRGREAFEADELLQNRFVRHLQIIGEAARLLPEEIRANAAGHTVV